MCIRDRLNDVLDMSKIESEKMKIETAPFNLRQMTEELKSMFSAQETDRKLRLEMNCSLQEDCYTGDKMRIQQVLTNLLSNACKFTDPGGTVVSVSYTHLNRPCGDSLRSDAEVF